MDRRSWYDNAAQRETRAAFLAALRSSVFIHPVTRQHVYLDTFDVEYHLDHAVELSSKVHKFRVSVEVQTENTDKVNVALVVEDPVKPTVRGVTAADFVHEPDGWTWIGCPDTSIFGVFTIKR